MLEQKLNIQKPLLTFLNPTNIQTNILNSTVSRFRETIESIGKVELHNDSHLNYR